MTQDEIIAMATEAGLNSYRIAPGEALAVWERFAALVAAKERDACAKVCSNKALRFAALVAAAEREACAQVAMEFRRGAGNPVCGEVAAAIRQRGAA